MDKHFLLPGSGLILYKNKNVRTLYQSIKGQNLQSIFYQLIICKNVNQKL